jgi:Arc/MetJ family transcription regulator
MGRTNIDIDDELVAAAMRATGLKTKRAAVEEGLRELTREDRLRRALERLRGIGWEGDPDETRRDREFDEYGNRIDEP